MIYNFVRQPFTGNVLEHFRMMFICITPIKPGCLVSNEQLDRTLAEELHEMNDKRIAAALKEIECNFRTTIEEHIGYHKYLEERAAKHNDREQAANHALRCQIYQQILDNYALSDNYNTR